MHNPIYHLATVADAAAFDQIGRYKTASLEGEGFIHCCTSTQLPGVIQRYYADATDAVVLTIDSEQLDNKLVFENTSGGTELFPHIYGDINAAAVTDKMKLDRKQIDSIAKSDEYLT